MADEPLGAAAPEGAGAVPAEALAPAAAAPAAAAAPVAAAATEAAPAAVPVAEAAAEPGSAIEGAVAEAVPEAVAEAAPEPEARTYEAWALPEGITLGDEQASAFNELAAKRGLDQEAAQELLTFGAEQVRDQVTAMRDQLAQQQHDVFAETRKGWRDTFDAQAGNARNTILGDAKLAITNAIPNEKSREELFRVLDFTGVGDHPAFIQLMANFGKRERERSAPGLSIPAQSTANPADRRYGKRG